MGFGFSFGVCAVDMGLRLGVYLVLMDCVGWVGVLFCLFFIVFGGCVCLFAGFAVF